MIGAYEQHIAPEAFEDAPVARAASSNTLKVGAVGLAGVLFMAVANAAPITAMTGNVPIAVGYGNGLGAPAGFLVATVVLTLFTVGFVAMARHITTAGAFYGFVTHGLGQLWGMAAGSGALGLFFAFWSWVGFETTAVYGEESRNPRRIVPRATLIAVIGLGLFYTFVSWMVIAGNGAKASVDLSNNNSIGMFTNLAEANLGGSWITYIYVFLIVSGSFACALAFHNAASRYLFAIGRELPATRGSLGATHVKHRTPHIASAVQSIVTLLLTVGFYFLTVGGSDPNRGGYIYLYGLLALLGTMAILIVQAITSLAVIWYFHVKKTHPGHWLTTGVIPALGGIGMLYVVYLLFSNIDFAGGGAAGSPFFKAIPWIVAATFVIGLGLVLVLRSRRPEVYRAIGRTVMEEAHDRAVEVERARWAGASAPRCRSGARGRPPRLRPCCTTRCPSGPGSTPSTPTPGWSATPLWTARTRSTCRSTRCTARSGWRRRWGKCARR